jgi:diguanylate cyclase (GGDEF)-like protein
MHGPVRNWLPRLHPDDRDRFKATLDVLLEHRKGKLNHEFRIRAEDGHFHWLQIRARPVLGSNGEIIRCVGTIVDVTEPKNSVERLLADAMHDNLTGLPNRQVFLDRLQSVLTIAATSDTVRPTVMAIDIDRYKQVNDSLGIAAGDNILIALTRLLRRLLKPQDTLARISGDQFGLILVSERDPGKVADFADAVSKAIMVPINFANREVILTASIGLSSWVDQQESAASLLGDAELAMYRAKRAGGNRGEFIPIAEMSDLISSLGMFALDRATADLTTWEKQTGELPVFMSVNLSSAQLLNADLYTEIRSLLGRTHFDPGRLKLELTESMMLENPEQARLVLAKLKETGISLALDDFGTGYSSLSHLTQFPFDTIKLDKSIVANPSDRGTVLLRSVISMARQMEMTVVAEGISCDEDAGELAKMGCQFGQSFLFGAPMAPDAVQRLLKERFPLTKRA